jgi:hypothetical protein
MEMGMQLGNGHAAWKWACSMDKSMQHGQRHAAWTGACSIDMNMQHEHGQDMEKTWTKTTIGPAWIGIVVNFFPEVFIENLAEVSES